MSNLYRLHQIKSAALEGTRPGLLQMMGNFASKNPYMVGGLGLGLGTMGINRLTRGRDDEGPGLMGTLGTLGLMGGAGYLLDRMGGMDGLQRGFQAYKKFGDKAGDMPMGKKLGLAKYFYGLSPDQQQSLIDSPAKFAISNPGVVKDFSQQYPGVANNVLKSSIPAGLGKYLPNFNFGGGGGQTAAPNSGTEYSAAPQGSELVTEPGGNQYSTMPPIQQPQQGGNLLDKAKAGLSSFIPSF